MAERIRNPIKYIAEIFRKNDWDPRLAIADNVYSRQYNIYAFSVAELITDSSNYWITWGGWFDNPDVISLQIIMNLFLTQTSSGAVMIGTVNSYYIDTVNKLAYMHLSINPWRYFQEYAKLYSSHETTYSTAPKDEANPSDIKYGITPAPPVMDVPSLQNELNDVISGIAIFSNAAFSIKLWNDDGRFDGMDITSLFNTPIKISKSSSDPQYIEDFDQVRYGLIEDINTEADSIVIYGQDMLYLMETEVCPKFTTDEFPDIDDGDVNEDIPIAWGAHTGVEPIEVDRDTADPCTWIDYIALDKDYITSVQGVYDEDGNSLTYTFNSATGVIRVTSVDEDGEAIEASYANVTGKTDNNLAEIIISILQRKERLPYIEGVWDITEVEAYKAIAPSIALYFDGGDTRSLIAAALKNDIAFLIQKNDGRLTLRRWGVSYAIHNIPSWLILEPPKKNFTDAKENYCSSVKINYSKFHKDNYYQSNYLDDSSESDIFQEYNKTRRASFDTDLESASDAENLAARLLDRFGVVRETVEVAVGVNTFDINLLDTVMIDVAYGNPARQFSEFGEWIVKKADPGQDVITLEGVGVIKSMTLDGTLVSIDGSRMVATEI